MGVPAADGEVLSLITSVGEGLAVGVSDALALMPTVSDGVLLAVLDAVAEGVRVGVHEGAAASPVLAQASGQGQAVGIPEPPGQNDPIGQITAVAIVDPAGQ